MSKSRYENQRARRVPPHVSLATLRLVSGMNGEQVCARVTEFLEIDKPFTRGALSAIENGHRGASLDVLSALEFAYEIPVGSIVTNYLPRSREQVPA